MLVPHLFEHVPLVAHLAEHPVALLDPDLELVGLVLVLLQLLIEPRHSLAFFPEPVLPPQPLLRLRIEPLRVHPRVVL